MLLLVLGAAATFVLFATDAFFAFAGWRLLASDGTRKRASVARLHAFSEKREPLFAAIAIGATAASGLCTGVGHPRVACLLGGAVVALAAHLLVYLKVGCLMRGFGAARVGSEEWRAVAGRLESAMVTRASLQAAAFICLVAAGMMR